MKTSLILHSRPSGIAWTGPTYLTSTDAMNDGKPARATRVEFAGGAIGNSVSPVATWPTAKVIRGGWLIIDRGGVAGIKIEVRGKRPADGGYTYVLGGNALTQRTVERDDGTIAIAWAFDDGLDAIIGLEFKIFDDANGAVWVDDYFDIGEVFFGEGTEVNIRREFSHELDDPTIVEHSIGNQPHVVERKRAEIIGIDICPVTWDDAYMSGDSLRRLRERLVGGKDCAIIVAFREPATGSAGAIDYDVVQATTWFGKCTELGTLRSVSEGARWAMEMTFRESPGRVVA